MAPAFSDAEVAAALLKAGIPADLHAEFLAFQREHGGQESAFGLNRVVWGILHRSPEWLTADEIEADQDDARPGGIWHVSCADVHPSDEMTLDQRGRLYWNWRLRYRYYNDYFAGQTPLDGSSTDL